MPVALARLAVDEFREDFEERLEPNGSTYLVPLQDTQDSESHEEVAAQLSLVVDATRLKSSIGGPTRNIWFQCPWISRDNDIATTAELLEDFIFPAAAIQKSGDAVFLGLTSREEYRDEYDLDNLKRVVRRLGYEMFMDEGFIRDRRGTFVLVKREHSEHTSVKEHIGTQRKMWAESSGLELDNGESTDEECSGSESGEGELTDEECYGPEGSEGELTDGV
ncbi:hypothetical protein DFH09DRAFT_1330317 [Mycena vulgaris]|nr:hypothetical protein DFH09DRAFT_1331453 [Mycena vulgaris]KAJ6522951.1 hypothetical protein DFH09DRAFT_1330317 [Mycena vulgaris]